MTILVSMPAERFAEFTSAAAASYAADNVASGRWSPDEAEVLARAELERLLPNGHSTPDHFLYDIRSEPEGAAVGFVWLTHLARGSTRVAYLLELLVLPQHRRRGHARAALAAVEALAAAQGLTTLALNVFGSNGAAQDLYRSVGYVVTSLSMQKKLPPVDVA